LFDQTGAGKRTEQDHRGRRALVDRYCFDERPLAKRSRGTRWQELVGCS
jgi:hypothetical protein